MKRYFLPIWMAAVATMSMLQGFSNRGYYLDDSYIVLRYGYNLSRGLGWCYNPGEKINGSTSPLNTLAAAAANLISPERPELVMHLFDEIFIAAALLAVVTLLAEAKKYAATVAAPLALIADPLLHSVYGLETVLYLMLGLVSLLCFQRKSRILGLALGLMVLARPDAAIFAALLLLAKTMKDRKIPVREIVIMLVVLLPWLIFSLVYFHELFPNTLFAKMAQGRSGFWHKQMFLPSLHRFWTQRYPGLLFPAAIGILALLGIYEAFKSFFPGLILFLWAASQVVFYALLQVPGYHWYFAPAALVLDLLLALGTEKIWSFAKSFPPGVRLGSRVAAVAVIVALLFPQLALIQSSFGLKMPEREKAYLEVGKWLAENTGPEQSLLAVEIGALGFYLKRRMVDPTGLISSAPVIAELRNARFDTLLNKNPPDFILAHKNIWPMELMLLSKSKSSYQDLKIFKFDHYQDLILFKKVATP